MWDFARKNRGKYIAFQSGRTTSGTSPQSYVPFERQSTLMPRHVFARRVPVNAFLSARRGPSVKSRGAVFTALRGHANERDLRENVRAELRGIRTFICRAGGWRTLRVRAGRPREEAGRSAQVLGALQERTGVLLSPFYFTQLPEIHAAGQVTTWSISGIVVHTMRDVL
jgi:hypothetical protein